MRVVAVATIAGLFSLFGFAYPAAAGPYVSATGAATFLSDSDLEDGGVEGEAEFDTGYGFTGALGQSWDPLPLGTLRTEIEAGYRKNDVDEISALGITAGGGDADIRALSGMVNVALDLNLLLFQPYVMGGVGLANLKFESDDFDVDDSDTVFAYQAGVGVGIPVAIVTLYGGYRYFATADPEFEGTDAEYHSHNVEVGVRLGF